MGGARRIGSHVYGVAPRPVIVAKEDDAARVVRGSKHIARRLAYGESAGAGTRGTLDVASNPWRATDKATGNDGARTGGEDTRYGLARAAADEARNRAAGCGAVNLDGAASRYAPCVRVDCDTAAYGAAGAPPGERAVARVGEVGGKPESGFALVGVKTPSRINKNTLPAIAPRKHGGVRASRPAGNEQRARIRHTRAVEEQQVRDTVPVLPRGDRIAGAAGPKRDAAAGSLVGESLRVTGADGDLAGRTETGWRDVRDDRGVPCRVECGGGRCKQRVIIVADQDQPVCAPRADIPVRRIAKPDMRASLVKNGPQIMFAAADKSAGIVCLPVRRREQADKRCAARPAERALEACRLRRRDRARAIGVKRKRGRDEPSRAPGDGAAAVQGEGRRRARRQIGETGGVPRTERRGDLERAGRRVVKVVAPRREMHALPCMGPDGKTAREPLCGVRYHRFSGLRRPVYDKQPGVVRADRIMLKPGRARPVGVAATCGAGYAGCCRRCRGTARGDNGVEQTCRPCRIARHIGLCLQRAKIVRHELDPACRGFRIQRDERLAESAVIARAGERIGREHDLRGAADKAARISVAAGVGRYKQTRDRRRPRAR